MKDDRYPGLRIAMLSELTGGKERKPQSDSVCNRAYKNRESGHATSTAERRKSVKSRQDSPFAFQLEVVLESLQAVSNA
ncbi:hypothetical protein D3C73_921730 [compost metagenome]